jgi:hypothetical protein
VTVPILAGLLLCIALAPFLWFLWTVWPDAVWFLLAVFTLNLARAVLFARKEGKTRP